MAFEYVSADRRVLTVADRERALAPTATRVGCA
jgi:hypothetical protein